MTVSKHVMSSKNYVGATLTISVADGNDTTADPFTEGDHIIITSADGTKRVYVLCDGSESGASATGTVITTGADTGASTLASATNALGTCVAVNVNFNTAAQYLYLNAIKAAIVHANGHNGKITAGDDATNTDGVQKIVFTQATVGPTGNRTITDGLTDARNILTFSSDSMGGIAFTGGEIATMDNNGGVIANAGTVSGNNRQITSKSILDLVKGADSAGSRPVVTTGSAHKPGIKAAFVTGGTFAFNPARASRSKTNTGFVMKYAPSNLGSKSNIGWSQAIPAGDSTSRVAGNIHPKTKTYQKGTWATQIFNLFGNSTAGMLYPYETTIGDQGSGNAEDTDSVGFAGLRQSDGTVKAGITGRGSASTYKNNRGSGNIDDSAQPAGGARAIPGEFVILSSFTGWKVTTSANNDTSGGGTGSGPYMDYSAITGG